MGTTRTANLYGKLKHALEQGDYRPGQRIPTEQELGRTFDVSITTVRRAVGLLVKEGLLDRRQGAGTFVSEPASRQARKLTSSVVGVIIPDQVSTTFYMCMASHIGNSLGTQGVRTLTFVARHFDQLKDNLLEHQHELQGLLICGYLLDHEKLAAMNIPYVIVGTEGPVNADCVSFNLERGVQQAVRHLVELGHKRVVFASHRCPQDRMDPAMQQLDRLETDVRLHGYDKGLAQAGIALDPQLILRCGPDKRYAFETMRDYLNEHGCGFTAVIAANDIVAEGILHALMLADIQIPQQCALVGCDNSALATQTLIPLTSIDLNMKAAVEYGIDMMFASRPRDANAAYRHTVVVPNLVVRQSSTHAVNQGVD
jgi:DNA-binding LacI/PurR family transcriptional regulator